MADNDSVSDDSGADSNADGTISIAGLLADDGAPVSELGQEVLAKMNGDDTNEDGGGEDQEEEVAEKPAPVSAKGAEKPKPEAPKKEWTAKVNGKMYKFDSEEKLLAAAQRGIATQQARNEEKAQLDSLRSEVEQMKSTLRQQIDFLQAQKKSMEETPEEFLRKHKNAEQIAEKLLIEKAQRWEQMQNMTPRERELFEQHEQAQAKLKSFEEVQKKAQATEEERLIEAQKEQIAGIMGAALKDAKLPANTTTIRTMAQIMRAAANKGVQLTKEQAAQLTRQQLSAIAKDSFGAMTPEDLVKNYPELAEGVRKHYVAKATGGAQHNPGAGVVKPAPRRSNGQFKPTEDMDPWEKELEKMKAEGREENRKNNVYGAY